MLPLPVLLPAGLDGVVVDVGVVDVLLEDEEEEEVPFLFKALPLLP